MIQSVLDVKDDTPYPKGSAPQPNFNRSILILTPQRALKFTATSKERHYVWLSALSFLSHSALGVYDLESPRPPLPQVEYEPVLPPNSATLRRNPIRDSIRVAKGKARLNNTGARAYTSPASTVRHEPFPSYVNDDNLDAAEPPHVPRFSSHSRKRSNTGPRPPTGTFRSIASHTHSAFTSNPSLHTTHTATSTDTHGAPPPPSSFFAGMRQASSAQSSIRSPRSSEASAPSATTGGGNFFDAVGTVRMEAFVDRSVRSDPLEPPPIPLRRGFRPPRPSRKAKDPDPRRAAPHAPPYRADGAGVGVSFARGDPFRGF